MTSAAAKRAWATRRGGKAPAKKVDKRRLSRWGWDSKKKEYKFPTLAQIRALSPKERKRVIRNIKVFEAKYGYMGSSH